MTALPLDDVRRLAYQAGLEEVQFNITSRVIAFTSDENVRFNVYYTTGTVGTYLLHPRQGKTQLFRRNVSLKLLEDIFRTPRIHTDFGYHRRYQMEEQRKRSRTLSGEYSTANGRYDDADDEEKAAKKQLDKLLAENEAIKNEISEVKDILQYFEGRREEERRKEEERKRREEEERIRLEKIAKENRKKELYRHRGGCGVWVLKETDDFCDNFTPNTSCVAVGDNGVYICLYDNGGFAYSSGLYANLYQKLHTRAPSHPPPDYVALGSNERYYISFTNGKSEWVGPDNLSDLLHKDKRRVKTVAFGEDWEDYFVVFESGGYEYVGCPRGLEEKINARGKRGDLEKVTLGPNGEWSLWAKNGRGWWGGIDSDAMKEISKRCNDITDLKFGSNGHYFIRYSS